MLRSWPGSHGDRLVAALDDEAFIVLDEQGELRLRQGPFDGASDDEKQQLQRGEQEPDMHRYDNSADPAFDVCALRGEALLAGAWGVARFSLETGKRLPSADTLTLRKIHAQQAADDAGRADDGKRGASGGQAAARYEHGAMWHVAHVCARRGLLLTRRSPADDFAAAEFDVWDARAGRRLHRALPIGEVRLCADLDSYWCSCACRRACMRCLSCALFRWACMRVLCLMC
jgi:hypothetical protein